MKACFIREFGGLEKVNHGELPNPLPARGEAVIRVRAAALNHLDLWVLKGRPGVHVVGGGVALAALQLARMAGAEVIATSSSPQKLAQARALGAIAGIDYKHEDVGKRAREITSGRGVDVVLDTVGAATLAASFAA